MLYNEERPHRFDDMVGQKHIVENIRNQSIQNKWFHSYIFAGQYGSGKTSMERIVSLAANCKNKDEKGNPCLVCENCKAILNGTTTDILEIDGASNTGVDSIRELRDSTGYMPVSLSEKVYVIDEAHMLSKGAFNALLKVLEEPPQHVIFILCTTDLKAIPATIRSRSAIYIFEQITYTDIFNKLLDVSNKYSFNISKDAIALIAKNADGAMRNAYSLLDQVTSGSSHNIEASDVQQILGLSVSGYLFGLLKNIILAKPAECISFVEQAASMGKDLSLMINELLEIVADAVVAKSASMDSIHDTEHYKEQLSEIVNISYVEQLCQIADGLMNIRVEMRKCPSKTTVIVGIIRITTSSITTPILNRLKTVEDFIKNGSLPISNKTSSLPEQQGKSAEAAVINEGMIAETAGNVISETFYETDKTTGGEDILHADTSSIGNANQVSQEETLEGFYEVEENVLDHDTLPEKETVSADDVNDTTDDQEIDEHDMAAGHGDAAEDRQTDKQDNGRKVQDEAIDSDEFDIFTILEDFNSASINTATNVLTPDGNSEPQKGTETGGESYSKQRRLEERLRLVSKDDEIFSTALHGCKRAMQNGKLVLRTPLRPVYVIVETYLKVTDVKEITVEYDSTISLN